MAAYRRVYDSRHLQADCQEPGRDQHRNPTLGNRAWATFTFYLQLLVCAVQVQSTDGIDAGFIEYSSCEMFSLNYSAYNRSQFDDWNRIAMVTNGTTIVRCSQWTYDRSQFISTIVSKVRYSSVLAKFH